jgi:hypothetical protein
MLYTQLRTAGTSSHQLSSIPRAIIRAFVYTSHRHASHLHQFILFPKSFDFYGGGSGALSVLTKYTRPPIIGRSWRA